MIIYILIFALSMIGARMADEYYDDHPQFIAYSFLAVLPPILIAGLKDTSVGYDTEMYMGIFNGIANNGQSFFEFIESYPDIEIGFLFLNYVVTRITDQFSALLFCIHILIIVPLYVSAIKWRRYLSPMLFMFVFYMIFFQESLSIFRQSISLSLSVLAFTLFLEEKYIKSVCYLIIAFLFHQTAFMALSFPLVYFVVDRFSLRQTYLLYVGILLGMLLFFVNLDNMLIWAIENDIIDLKFLKYTTADNAYTPVLGAANFVVKIVTVIFLVYVMIVYKPNALLKFFLVMAVLDMIFSLCALITQPLDRLSLYYRLMTCISLPYLIYNYPVLFKEDETPYPQPVIALLGALLFAYWFYVYMLGDYDQTANYQFSSI